MEFLIPAAFAGVLSMFSPMLIEWITNAGWTNNQKTLAAVLVSTVIAVLLGVYTGDLVLAFTSVEAFVQTAVPAVGVLFTIQQVVYTTIFKGSDLAHKISGDVEKEPEPSLGELE